MSISDEEKALRARDFAQMRHSIEMEGGHVPEETAADMAEFIEGLIDEDELLRRARVFLRLDV